MSPKASERDTSKVLLHDCRNESGVSWGGTMLFSNNVDIITCWTPDDIEGAFADIDSALAQGFHIAGGFCYELGYHLEPSLSALMPLTDIPLFQVGVFRAPDNPSWSVNLKEVDKPSSYSRSSAGIRVSQDIDAYRSRAETIKAYIAAGDIYQANYTFPLRFTTQLSVWDLYDAVLPFQPVPFGAVVDLPDLTAASFSPELFFRKTANLVEACPMKGTAPRGHTPEEDADNVAFLQSDEKNRAENLMIVDLIRNDLGRLAEIGSVSVEKSFQVDTFDTLHQMTSTVTASIKRGVGLPDVFRSMFPCGSVTGAPKIRAMEIIAEQEKNPRGLYCGAIGHITPERDMCFSVPIRTVTFDGYGGAVLRIGSGIVADSQVESEYDECLLKASFLSRALALDLNSEVSAVGLIETMRAVDGEIPLLQAHLTRLNKSAIALGIDIDLPPIKRALLAEANKMTGETRIRVQVDPGREPEVSAMRLTNLPDNPVVIPAIQTLSSKDPLRSHKSTERAVYEKEQMRLKEVPGAIDALFFNENGLLCEGAITNVFIESDGQIKTPSLPCGVLPGVMRAQLLEEWGAIEVEITRDELLRATRVIVCNAVRGPVDVRLMGFDDDPA